MCFMTVLNAMFMQKKGSENALQYFIHAIPQRDLRKQPNVSESALAYELPQPGSEAVPAQVGVPREMHWP